MTTEMAKIVDWGNVDGRRVPLIICPYCKTTICLDKHKVVVEDPLTLDASVVCPHLGCGKEFSVLRGQIVKSGKESTDGQGNAPS